MARSSYYKTPFSTIEADQPVRDALNEVVTQHTRWGFWMIYHRLRQLGHLWNHKRVLRVYRQMRLNLPRRSKKRIPTRQRQKLEVPSQANQMWAMDFMQDTLICGKRFRVLNVLDEGVREALAIILDTSLPAERVIRTLEQLSSVRDLPTQIRVDNGPELISHKLQTWCKERGIHLHHIQPGKPAQNAYIERFNRSFRTEVLNAHLFDSLSGAQQMAEEWMYIYNNERPHTALNNLPPAKFVTDNPNPSPGRQSGKTNKLVLPEAPKDDTIPSSIEIPRARYRSGINGSLPADAGPLHLFRSDLAPNY